MTISIGVSHISYTTQGIDRAVLATSHLLHNTGTSIYIDSNPHWRICTQNDQKKRCTMSNDVNHIKYTTQGLVRPY